MKTVKVSSNFLKLNASDLSTLSKQKFDFRPAMCYNLKVKLVSQRLIKLDVRAQGSDEIMGGLSK